MFVILQQLSCVTLLAASLWWLIKHGKNPAHRFLFPYIIAATAGGLLLALSYFIEVFIANFSGSKYELEAFRYRFTGPYAWAYVMTLCLPMLPAFGFIPAIGRRPAIMIALAIIAAVPFETLIVILVALLKSAK